MWRFLAFLASPKIFYKRIGQWTPWFGRFALLFLTVGTVWGLYFAPADYQQGDAFRMLYVHVPAAMLSMALYAFMGALSLSLLVWRIKLAGVLLRATAPIGASMALLALITGSLWGKPMWGAWWIWDARLTSELVLLLLYLAILVLQQAYQNQAAGDKLMAILSLVGLLDLPIIHYSVYWWNTLHQGASLMAFAKPAIHASMLYPLLMMIIGFFLYAIYMISLKSRNILLAREYRSKWVQALLEENIL
ncbi:MAG: heme ABC transporter permease CcmC [Gammaproteobacteria bacterium]|nr:heme ABC transporter permease CcmC [Gammaproteobacteria bacterium]MCH9763518.1 heme ABC transporter permease CcmC [Gammaproteobacteria bacterium]